jgi:hypothetical protein
MESQQTLERMQKDVTTQVAAFATCDVPEVAEAANQTLAKIDRLRELKFKVDRVLKRTEDYYKVRAKAFNEKTKGVADMLDLIYQPEFASLIRTNPGEAHKRLAAGYASYVAGLKHDAWLLKMSDMQLPTAEANLKALLGLLSDLDMTGTDAWTQDVYDATLNDVTAMGKILNLIGTECDIHKNELGDSVGFVKLFSAVNDAALLAEGLERIKLQLDKERSRMIDIGKDVAKLAQQGSAREQALKNAFGAYSVRATDLIKQVKDMSNMKLPGYVYKIASVASILTSAALVFAGLEAHSLWAVEATVFLTLIPSGIMSANAFSSSKPE